MTPGTEIHTREVVFEPLDAQVQRSQGNEPIFLRCSKELLEPKSGWYASSLQATNSNCVNTSYYVQDHVLLSEARIGPPASGGNGPTMGNMSSHGRCSKFRVCTRLRVCVLSPDFSQRVGLHATLVAELSCIRKDTHFAAVPLSSICFSKNRCVDRSSYYPTCSLTSVERLILARKSPYLRMLILFGRWK